jgi:hypothetical protein
VGPAGHPLGPHISGLCTRPPHVRCVPRVTLILIEFLISLEFLKMLQFGTYVPEIKYTLKLWNQVSRQGKYMVISYIYSICWHMKLAFYEL